MRYNRIISAKIARLLKHFPAIVLTGARQTGKTTLLKQQFPDYNYVSLDSFQNAELAEHQPERFLSEYPSPLIIDEVQYAPKLFRHLKLEIDKQRDKNGQFILTGSQKFTLMNEVSDSLAGRVALLELEGLCSMELAETINAALSEHGPEYVIHRGMFPELWDDRELPATDFYRSYLSTYIERDVRQLLNISSLREFDRFMRAAAARNAQLLNKTELAKDVGVSAKTIGHWLSVLEASNQVTLLEPYFANVGKRIVKSPRLFFNDTGLLCYLLGLSAEAIRDYTRTGFIWESYVLAELRKLRAASGQEVMMWFYRDGSGREVDLILDYDGKLDLLEIKWTELPSAKHEKNLIEVETILAGLVRKKAIVSRSRKPSTTASGSLIIDGFHLKSNEFPKGLL